MKNKFINSVLILSIGSFITKVISMFIKIVLARYLGTEGTGVYMLITPTFTLLMAISQLGFPVAISKIVAEGRNNNKNIVFSLIPISLLINVFIIFILFLLADYISLNLLKDERTYYGIISIGFVLPFISISSILRGYFFGKQKMIPHVISNVTEDLVRLIVIFIFLPFFIEKGLKYAIAFVVLVNIVSELTSILILFFFLPKNFKIYKDDLKPDYYSIKEIFSVGIPTTMSRIIGCIGFFLEPIILTFVLSKIGYSNSFIVNEYGIISGYVLPLVLLPSFLTLGISEALIPNVSKAYCMHNYSYVYNKVKYAIRLSLLLGLLGTLVFEFFPSLPMKFIYGTTSGIKYLRVLGIIALIHYVQSPLTATLQAMGKAKEAMRGTFWGTIFRSLSLFLFSFFNIGMWGLIIGIGVNIVFVTLHQYLEVRKALL